jgi:hypothetical protein
MLKSRAAMLVLGLLFGAAAMWTVAHFAGPSFVGHDLVEVEVLDGVANYVNIDSTSIFFVGSGRREGFSVAGALWRQDDGNWNVSDAPTCLEPLSSGQRVTLGVVDVPRPPGGFREVVVWLECDG